MHSVDIKEESVLAPVETKVEYYDRIEKFKATTDLILNFLSSIDKEYEKSRDIIRKAINYYREWDARSVNAELMDYLYFLKLKTRSDVVRNITIKTINAINELVGKEEEISLCNTYFTPIEMLRKGVFGIEYNDGLSKDDADYTKNHFGVKSYKDTMIDDKTPVRYWFTNHTQRYAGIQGKDDAIFDKLLDATLKEATATLQSMLANTEESDIVINSHRQYILELGWNPNVLYTGQKINRIERKSERMNMIDYTDYVDDSDDAVNEALRNIEYDGTNVPVFIVLTEGERMHGKLIKKVTNSSVTHSSIAFDLNMDRIYSFNEKGFIVEDKNSFSKHDNRIEVYTVIMHRSQANKIKVRLDELLAGKKNYGYNYLGLIGFALGKPVKRNERMFCSEFVDGMFRLANFDLTDKNAGLVSPGDFGKSKNKNIYKIYDGRFSKFSKNKENRKVKKILQEYNKALEEGTLYEAKEFPVQFDTDGNLLIKKAKKLDFEKEYYNSHKLLEIYRRTENYEGMKYELSKLWFMITILEDKIYNSNESAKKKEEYTKVRAKILNDFKTNLLYVSDRNNDFVFIEYYEHSPFSDATYRISKSTVDRTIDLLKSIVF